MRMANKQQEAPVSFQRRSNRRPGLYRSARLRDLRSM